MLDLRTKLYPVLRQKTSETQSVLLKKLVELAESRHVLIYSQNRKKFKCNFFSLGAWVIQSIEPAPKASTIQRPRFHIP
jgi:hypothetical protein